MVRQLLERRDGARPRDTAPEELGGDGGDGPLWLRVLGRYGVVAAIAIFLVWQLTQNVQADVRATREMLILHAAEQRYLLTAICYNVAHDEAQRAACVQR